MGAEGNFFLGQAVEEGLPLSGLGQPNGCGEAVSLGGNDFVLPAGFAFSAEVFITETHNAVGLAFDSQPVLADFQGVLAGFDCGL